jgi:hypothetical protein
MMSAALSINTAHDAVSEHSERTRQQANVPQGGAGYPGAEGASE